eukprot:5368738-Pleurochrysis_carterae.AAC.1
MSHMRAAASRARRAALRSPHALSARAPLQVSLERDGSKRDLRFCDYFGEIALLTDGAPPRPRPLIPPPSPLPSPSPPPSPWPPPPPLPPPQATSIPAPAALLLSPPLCGPLAHSQSLCRRICPLRPASVLSRAGVHSETAVAATKVEMIEIDKIDTQYLMSRSLAGLRLARRERELSLIHI